MTTRLALVALALVVTVSPLRAADADRVKADEKVLRDAKQSVDGPALLEFLRKRTLADGDRDRVLDLVRKLGDDDFRIREQSLADLIAFGASASPLLRQATQSSDDIEVIRRCERCLDVIDKEARLGLIAATVRLTADRKPPGAAAVLLDFLPFADDESVADEIRDSLVELAMRDGKPEPAVTAALDGKDSLRRAVAAAALLRAGTADQRKELSGLLTDADAAVRHQAALAFFDAHDKQSVPVLIDLLADLPLERAYSIEDALFGLAGEEAPQATLSKGQGAAKKAREAWQAWWTKHGEKIDLAKLDRDGRYLGLTLVVEWNNQNLIGRVKELDREGKVRWALENQSRPVDAVIMGQDRVAVAEYTTKRVVLRNFKGDEIWQKAVGGYINGLQKLANGNLLVCARNQVLELDREGKELSSWNRPNNDVFSAQKTRDGKLLVVTRTGQCLRIDGEGKEEKAFALPAGFGVVSISASVDLLPNGRLLMPMGQPQNKVVEVDEKGKIVWEKPFTNPNAVMRLPNGHTLVTSYLSNRAAELDRDGKEVWTYTGEGRVVRVRKR